MKEQLAQELEKIGLSEKEARVYLASLELGSSTAQTIAAKATVNRPTTYIMIESLIKRGLMSSFEQGKKRYFVAAPPEGLSKIFDQDISVLQNRKVSLAKLFPLFSELAANSEAPKVTLFEGKIGLSAVHQDMLNEARKTGMIDNIASIDSSRSVTSEEQMRPLWDDITKNNIRVRTIYTKSGGKQSYPQSENHNWLSKRISSDKFNFGGEISIYGNKVAALAFTKEEIGIVIQNKDIADTLRVLFELAWNGSDKFNE